MTKYFKLLYQKISQCKKHILFIFAFTLLLLLDDHIFQIFNNANKVRFFGKTFWFILAISFILSFVKNIKVIYAFLALFLFLDFSQLGYLAYFGTYLDPIVIPQIFLELPEILQSGFGDFGKVYYVFLAVGIPYSALFYITHKYHKNLYKIKFFWILLLIMLCYFPRKAINANNINPLLTNYERPSLYNGFKLYSAYFFNILPNKSKYKIKEFEPYVMTKNTAMDVNIIILYGESFNHHNIRDETMPHLTKIAKTEPNNFTMTKGISIATFTNTSVPMFFNMQKEAENYQMQIDKNFNLWKLAKEQNFKTLFISTQGRGTTNSMGVKNIDTLIAYQDEEKLINTINDDAVLEIFKRYDINEGNNFVVLHQRNLHSPYRANYIHREQEFNKFSNEYDNCMLYEDSLLNDLITELKKTNKTFYLFITSDHGEMTGQNGKWGHGTLDPLSAEIPMMLYTNDKNKTILNEFKKIWSPTHWDILQIITKIMGYKVDNPNTPDNVYYINNTDLMGRDGFIKVIKDTKNKKIDYEIVR
ncbi:MAG: lipooligosaccharide phosphoethanolamine transferase [Rickettsiales bacterium]|nr:MAG: lipooligosaccharide phosphoethanolamine transferase [Rickettsiales bacterium]